MFIQSKNHANYWLKENISFYTHVILGDYSIMPMFKSEKQSLIGCKRFNSQRVWEITVWISLESKHKECKGKFSWERIQDIVHFIPNGWVSTSLKLFIMSVKKEYLSTCLKIYAGGSMLWVIGWDIKLWD